MDDDTEYKKINVNSELFYEIRQYCDDNGIRLLDFIEDALEIALYEDQVSLIDTKHDTSIGKKKSSLKNKSDKYSPIKLYTEFKDIHPKHIIFTQCGSFYEVLNNDAMTCSELFGWIVFNRGENRVAGIPVSQKEILIEKLKRLKVAYIIVEQNIDENDMENPIKREITEIFPD